LKRSNIFEETIADAVEEILKSKAVMRVHVTTSYSMPDDCAIMWVAPRNYAKIMNILNEVEDAREKRNKP